MRAASYTVVYLQLYNVHNAIRWNSTRKASPRPRLVMGEMIHLPFSTGSQRIKKTKYLINYKL